VSSLRRGRKSKAGAAFTGGFMDAMISLENVQKKYGQKTAVKGISLEIPRGELFAFVGPNGAGKTSTLKMLVGLLQITSGRIKIGGYDIEKEAMKAKSLLSFVPDVPYVYDKLTPRELLRFIGKLYSLTQPVIEERTGELLSFFSLEHVKDVLIEEFSHGMKQKAVLSAALLHKPKILILDEPMVGLDPMSIKSFKEFLKRESQSGMTILFSTHTLSMAEELGQRIGIINKGELVALGSLEELQHKYQSRENLENMFLRLIETEEPQGKK